MVALSDDQAASQLLQLFQQLGSSAADGVSIRTVHKHLKCSYGQIRRMIRGRPTEFGMYNDSRCKTAMIVCLTVGQQAHDQPAANGSDPASTSGGDLHCPTCDVSFATPDAMRGHLSGSRHKMKVLLKQVRSSGSIHSNQGGLQVSELPEQQGLQMALPKLLWYQIDNVGTATQQLLKVYQVRRLPEVAVLLDVDPSGMWLRPGDCLLVPVEVTPRYAGMLCTLLIFEFAGFLIARELRAECDPCAGDPGLPDISATAPFQRQQKKVFAAAPAVFEPGEREKKAKTPWQKPPRQHTVPNSLRTLLSEGRTSEVRAELSRFKATSDLSTHVKKLHLLLHLEELQQEVDVRMYDMEQVTLQKSGLSLLALEVPGLAEARPSVLRGDALYVAPCGQPAGGCEFQGWVHVVREKEVLLRFSKRFHDSVYLPGRRFNVRFAIKRTSFVFMHEALDVAERGLAAAAAGARPELLLPPAHARAVPGRPVEVRKWFDAKLASNPEQPEAVRCVLGGTSGRLPFIIWGPPGTGKTSTLVEAAVQVLARLPNSRVLLVAPSNLAADLLAQRLLASGRPKSELLRICAFSRPREDLATDLDDVALWDDNVGAFRMPSLSEVTAGRVRAVVVTAIMAAKLHAMGVPAGHFTNIMFDEAGHAEEPLALCCLAGLTGQDTSVTLAGDPKQLGPVIHSRMAADAGLALSLLERLISSPPYAAAAAGGSGSGAARGLIVKLVRNYRSHPSLLELPSRLFYNGELLACADRERTHTLLHWQELPNKDFPILFHGVVGKDEREANSPSWFNVTEAKLVLSYVEKLLTMRGRNRVTANQIGVITPYRKQVQKVRKLLDAKGWGAVQVGSVEQLQGQERRVIIISTVRSDASFLEHDLKHKLGFVASPKRFNVVITRAQALMIVIGNPAVLAHDPCWRALLKSCLDYKATKGCPMPDVSGAAAGPGSSAGSSSGGGGDDVAAQIDDLQRLLASMSLDKQKQQHAAGTGGADWQLAAFSGLVEEAGGRMVRHE